MYKRQSLAIEGNMLSEDEVKDIIDGKTVMAPLRQIQEVKNAIKTYEPVSYTHLDVYKRQVYYRPLIYYRRF